MSEYNADYNSGYEDGLRDAWECAKKVAMYDVNIYAVFDTTILKNVWDMNPSEAIAKLKEYEAKQSEIKVGDELQNELGERFVVIGLNDDGKSVQALCGNGKFYHGAIKKYLTKTGRHYDIDGILEQLKGADDEH